MGFRRLVGLVGLVGLVAAWLALSSAARAASPDDKVQELIQKSNAGAAPVAIPGDYQPMVDLAVMLGNILYRTDHATSVATDLAATRLAADPRARGWLTMSSSDGVHVLFIGEEGDKPGLLYHVFVPETGAPRFQGITGADANTVVADPPRPDVLGALDGSFLHEWNARKVAVASRWDHFAPAYNPVLVEISPGMSGKAEYWVYMLPTSANPDDVVLSGASAVVLAQADLSLVAVMPYSSGYLAQRRSDVPAGAELDAMLLYSPLADYPRETHVYTSLRYKLPLFVATDAGVWKVDGAKITWLGPAGKKKKHK